MTDKINDGGPAFPREAYVNPHGVEIRIGSDGMTLRDWFAGQAPDVPNWWLEMQRNIDRQRNPLGEPHKPAPREYLQLLAEWRWAYADAMLAARGGST